MCFQLLGTDIDLDSNLHPWLIESNVNPSLGATLNAEIKDKKKMIYTMFSMIQIAENDTSLAKTRQKLKDQYDSPYNITV